MTLPPECVLPVTVCAVVAAACWLLSVLTREYSWVDRIWSVVPPVYVGIFAAQADWGDARLNLMTALTTAWAARLTFNFWRKGGYARGGEDYRWAVLRERMSPALYQVFNVVFIAGYQNLLLLLIAMPAWAAWQHRGAPLGPLDWATTVVFLALLVGEFIADQQQWNFHQAKTKRRERGEPEPLGFCDGGLWAWSRHPNFFCEQGQWWAVYVFGVAAGAPWLNPTIVGAVLLTLLFHGSTNFTEQLSAAKYPAYADYQRRTSRLLPWPPRR
jgi:steroid 5-alpha reductase family enzyme